MTLWWITTQKLILLSGEEFYKVFNNSIEAYIFKKVSKQTEIDPEVNFPYAEY